MAVVKFTSTHPSPHHRHDARTALIRSLLAVEEVRLDDALAGALLAVVQLRNAMSDEQFAAMTRKIGIHISTEDLAVPNDAAEDEEAPRETWVTRSAKAAGGWAVRRHAFHGSHVLAECPRKQDADEIRDAINAAISAVEPTEPKEKES